MDDRDLIRLRIINRAVTLYAKHNPDGGSVFTTAHYAQALKEEFKTPGPVLASEDCVEHLEAMADVESASSCLWRRTGVQSESDITEAASPPANPDFAPDDACVESDITPSDAQIDAIERARVGILRIAPGNGWWCLESLAKELTRDVAADTPTAKALCVNIPLAFPDVAVRTKLDDTVVAIVGFAMYSLVMEGRAVRRRMVTNPDGGEDTVFSIVEGSA